MNERVLKLTIARYMHWNDIPNWFLWTEMYKMLKEMSKDEKKTDGELMREIEELLCESKLRIRIPLDYQDALARKWYR